MNRAVSKALADCIAEMERGAPVEECFKRHPAHVGELRPAVARRHALEAAEPVQPSTAAFEPGRRAMLNGLESAPVRSGPLAAARLAPAWATVAAAVAAFLILSSGAAGASAALGGPDPAGDGLSAVGVSSDSDAPHGGIGESSASDRGRDCANPNAFEGSGNSLDKAQNAEDAHQKQSCSKGADEGATANQAGAGCEDANNGHGNDADHDDADNPGQGEGNNGANGESAGGDGAAGQEGEDTNNGHGNGAGHDDAINRSQGAGHNGTGSNAGGNGNPNGDPNGNTNPNEPQGQDGGLNKN